ncbi:MAG: MBL fold metallo-hydrolase, partial [Muribaculaceae bacterium]|nr:MBL fold metallo-hydrolase [Muribaculaceae bacterium]
MKLTFLGTGTSTGVPQIGCNCAVCSSPDPREKRLRASVLVEVNPGFNLLIDCGPDFREQMLRVGSPSLQAVLLTHSHYDHVGGIDDLRPYCYPDSFPVYCQADVAQDLRERVPY